MSVLPPSSFPLPLALLTYSAVVQGILILTRPTGMIVKSSGPLFALPVNGESEESGATVGHSESARKYAGMAYRCVKSCEEEARGLDEKVSTYCEVRGARADVGS